MQRKNEISGITGTAWCWGFPPGSSAVWICPTPVLGVREAQLGMLSAFIQDFPAAPVLLNASIRANQGFSELLCFPAGVELLFVLFFGGEL